MEVGYAKTFGTAGLKPLLYPTFNFSFIHIIKTLNTVNQNDIMSTTSRSKSLCIVWLMKRWKCLDLFAMHISLWNHTFFLWLEIRKLKHSEGKILLWCKKKNTTLKRYLFWFFQFSTFWFIFYWSKVIFTTHFHNELIKCTIYKWTDDSKIKTKNECAT